jgi:hypothetical protein
MTMTTTTDVRSVAERLDQGAKVDVTSLHLFIQRGMRKLAEQLYAALPVKEHPASAPYRTYQSPNGAMTGEVHAASGSPIDWSIESFIANPAVGFCNHQLTTYLDASVRVPHLAFAIGTIPQLFFYCDLVPRSDLWTNTKELDRYHAHFNDRVLRVAADRRFTPFVSREIYIRGALSPAGICVQSEASEAIVRDCLTMAEETLTTWIEWVKEAEPVPEKERAALAARDDLVRRTICWRDPANIVAERVLGKKVTDDLVRILSAEARGERAPSA